MRIAIDVHFIGQRQTGNETYTRNLVENLASVELPGVDLHYYHTLPSDKFEHASWRGAVHRVYPHTSLVRIPVSFPLTLWKHKIDLAHFQYVSPPLCPCPTVLTIHDISYEFFPEYFNPRQRARMQLLVPSSGRRAAHVLTVSEYSRRQLIEKYRFAEDRVTATPLGVSPAFRILPDEETATVTSRFKLPERYILGVGNVQPRKNLIRLIRAFASLRRKKSIPHELVLVGQPAWKSAEILQEIETQGIKDVVKVTGYVSEEELVALYNRAEIFAYPSLYEGFGLPIVEAMACGTPVITSNVTSMPEVAGDAALLIDPMSEEEISAAMLKLIDDQALARQVVERGLKQSKTFNWRRAAEQTAAVYKRCA